jgi:hypothetical protein
MPKDARNLAVKSFVFSKNFGQLAQNRRLRRGLSAFGQPEVGQMIGFGRLSASPP